MRVFLDVMESTCWRGLAILCYSVGGMTLDKGVLFFKKCRHVG